MNRSDIMEGSMNEQGSLSINSENLFPIIKKWLYSDHDIFVREMISNSSDAITKVKKLEIMGECQFDDDEKFRIDVVINPEEKTIKFIDNGIGMTTEEVKEYITQIAFSGATDFLEKYKDKTNEDQIIGHFGLGFYSAFMVSDKYLSIRSLIKRGRLRFTGNVTEKAIIPWVKETGRLGVPRSPYTSMKTVSSFPTNTVLRKSLISIVLSCL